MQATKEMQILVKDGSVLRELLSVVFEHDRHRPGTPGCLKDVLHLVRQRLEVLERFPGRMAMHGDYVGPHCAGKFFLGMIASLADQEAEMHGRYELPWEEISLEELAEAVADKGGYLQKLLKACPDMVPHKSHHKMLQIMTSAAEIGDACRCPPHKVAMWFCLWHDPIKKHTLQKVEKALAEKMEELWAL